LPWAGVWRLWASELGDGAVVWSSGDRYVLPDGPSTQQRRRRQQQEEAAAEGGGVDRELSDLSELSELKLALLRKR
jgi:hypothetical protein